MALLVLFKHDHAADQSVEEKIVAALPSPFDLIDWFPDGVNIGEATLDNPWFRVLRWASPDNVINTLMGREYGEFDHLNEPLNHPQFRISYLGGLDKIPNFTTWWEDNSRRVPIFEIVDHYSLIDFIKRRPKWQS